jgi:hypothetical protein
MKNFKLAVAAILFTLGLGQTGASAAECPNLTGTYLLDSSKPSHTENDEFLVISQKACASVEMTWYTGKTPGLVYKGIIDGKSHKISSSGGAIETQAWSWNKKVLELQQVTEFSGNESKEELDFSLERDADGNLDAIAQAGVQGLAPMSMASVYYKISEEK